MEVESGSAIFVHNVVKKKGLCFSLPWAWEEDDFQDFGATMKDDYEQNLGM